MTSVSAALRRPSREDAVLVGLLANTLVLAALVYVVSAGISVTQPRYALYGLAWVFVGVLAVWKTEVAPTDRATRRRAAAVAVVYAAVLAVAGGVLVTNPGQVPGEAWSVRVAALAPGWGPAPVLSTPHGALVLMPARVVGYAALSYLVYATAIDASGSAVSGLLGLLSCVSCSWPILVSILTGVVGGGSAVAALAFDFSYDISTAVFLVTAGLLYWRPFGFRGE